VDECMGWETKGPEGKPVQKQEGGSLVVGGPDSARGTVRERVQGDD
jgi:hypothetical protein